MLDGNYGDGEGVPDATGLGVASTGAAHSEPSSKRTARIAQPLLPDCASNRQRITAPGENFPAFAKSVFPMRIKTSFAVFSDVFRKEMSKPLNFSP